MEKRKLPDGWEWKRLGDVGSIERNLVNEAKELSQYSSFIGLENIESDNGTIPGLSREKGNNIKSSKFKFTSKDILYGKLRPYLNKVDLPGFDGICSTDILVIKPNLEKIDRRYLVYAMRSDPFVQYATTRSSGANLPRISPKVILEYYIPLPPLPIQRRIVEILEQADALRRLRAQSDGEMQKLLQSVFYEMFGDPVKNEKGWEVMQFGDCFKSIRYGVSSPPIFSSKGVPFIRATNVKNGIISENNLKYVSYNDSKNIEKCIVREGNIIIVRSGVNTGDCAYIPPKFDGSLAAYDIIIEFDEKEQGQFYNSFVATTFCKSRINLLKRRAAQEHLNVDQISSLEVPVPPVPLQRRFARIVKDIEGIREEQVKLNLEFNNLFDGLVARAFTGELVA